MKIFSVLVLGLMLAGCAGSEREFTRWDGGKIVFPNGTVFGGASSAQVQKLAEIFVEAHNESMEMHRETAAKSLGMLEDLSKRQGSGEITIFYNSGSNRIPEGSLEYERLVRFLDYLSREAHGRKILLVSIGSASSYGNKRHNERLAERRSKAPIPTVEKFLVNIPHEFYRVYSVGDRYSPGGMSIAEQKKYQHTRIIAVFEFEQLKNLPE